MQRRQFRPASSPIQSGVGDPRRQTRRARAQVSSKIPAIGDSTRERKKRRGQSLPLRSPADSDDRAPPRRNEPTPQLPLASQPRQERQLRKELRQRSNTIGDISQSLAHPPARR